MKPYARKIGRIECPQCHSANLDIVIKGMIGTVGVESAIRETEECPICHYRERKTLSPENLLKVDETNNTEMLKAKNMYKIQATRKLPDGETWNWIKWNGQWDGEAMGELTRAISEACKGTRAVPNEDGEMEDVQESGMLLDRSGEKAMLLIRSDFMPNFEEVLDLPMFQDSFTPFARVSDDKIAQLRDAFKDAE